MGQLASNFQDDFAGEGRVTFPSYAFNRFGSPPGNTKGLLGDQCNVHILLLTLCEHSPVRLPCIPEYLWLLYCTLDLAPGKPTFSYTKYTRPYHLLLPLGVPFGLRW